MRPPRREFEQVKVDEWLMGEIAEIKYDNEHEFITKGEKDVAPGIKIGLALDGYKDKKSTGWWKFSYSDKSKVYKFFIQPLVEGAHPYMDFDFDNLLNLRIKIMYTQNGEYQNIMAIRPDGGKVLPSPAPAKSQEDEVPF